MQRRRFNSAVQSDEEWNTLNRCFTWKIDSPRCLPTSQPLNYFHYKSTEVSAYELYHVVVIGGEQRGDGSQALERYLLLPWCWEYLSLRCSWRNSLCSTFSGQCEQSYTQLEFSQGAFDSFPFPSYIISDWGCSPLTAGGIWCLFRSSGHILCFLRASWTITMRTYGDSLFRFMLGAQQRCLPSVSIPSRNRGWAVLLFPNVRMKLFSRTWRFFSCRPWVYLCDVVPKIIVPVRIRVVDGCVGCADGHNTGCSWEVQGFPHHQWARTEPCVICFLPFTLGCLWLRTKSCSPALGEISESFSISPPPRV